METETQESWPFSSTYVVSKNQKYDLGQNCI